MKTVLCAIACVATVLMLSACGGLVRSEMQSISPEDVVVLSRQGQSPTIIIEKMVRSDSVYKLTASQLVQLARDGVPEPVLDHMQRTHILAIKREARRSGLTEPRMAFVPAL